MANSIIGIPTTRLSDLFVRDQLLNQLQSNESDLFKIQTQLSTGYRFQSISDPDRHSLKDSIIFWKRARKLPTPITYSPPGCIPREGRVCIILRVYNKPGAMSTFAWTCCAFLANPTCPRQAWAWRRPFLNNCPRN